MIVVMPVLAMETWLNVQEVLGQQECYEEKNNLCDKHRDDVGSRRA